MGATFRLELCSTETRPSKETQESVLPALSQKFGRRVTIHAAELTREDRRRAATIGTVDVSDPGVLQEVYEYLQPHNLVKVETVKTDRGGVVARRAHEVDRDAIDARGDARVVADVRGHLLVHVRGERRGSSPVPEEDSDGGDRDGSDGGTSADDGGPGERDGGEGDRGGRDAPGDAE